MFDIVIIGGGLSGLAAAVELAKNGQKVGLFDHRPRLGGRCYSFLDHKTGDVVDNGQHILLGAYHNLLRYLDLIGSRHLLKSEPALSLTFHHSEKGRVKFEVLSLRKPFPLAMGMLKFKLLTFADRRRLLKVGYELHRWNDRLEMKLSVMSVDEWLTGLNQSEEAKKCLWFPIAVSIMNEIPEKASALLFARALRAAFMGDKSDSAILIPTVGQTELYVSQAEEFLSKHRALVFLNNEVESIVIEEGSALGITLKSGDFVAAKKTISTVPSHVLLKLLPTEYGAQGHFKNLSSFTSSPIISINLWFEKDFMDIEYLGLIDRDLQWVFNRRKIMNETKPTAYLTVVISAAHQFINLPKDKLLACAVRDIHQTFPESRKSKLIHSVIIKEKRATFSGTNFHETHRPSSATPIRNLYLAGDWTNTGLPATIEGAVMSGFKAADLANRQT